MPALTKDRNTPQRSGEVLALDVAANAEIFAGSLVVLNATGYAAPGSTAVGLKVAGRAEEYVDNSSGADGDAIVRVKRGVFKFANDIGDPVAQDDLLGTCYIVDDQTVAATDGAGTRSAAGKVIAVEADGVWVEID
ncbi:hypothetical protein [Desulfotruncus alcoholivorax]|uniref:hypothetical protein n=1 Tax=Desulfotruncus alcoholivorax TaxID=265477 RepID=UPI0004266180|nr:hypothetical protein [Desulfotruncus alcoholivorax]